MRGVKNLILCVLILCGAYQPNYCWAHEPMLPRVYSKKVDVTGWLMSEKLDGVRGYWDGHHLYSKKGHQFHPPQKFVRDLPAFPLEGELWGGRGTFEQTLSVVQRKQPTIDWLKLKFAIFDAPAAPGGFVQRINVVRKWFYAKQSDYAFVIDQIVVDSAAQMQQKLAEVESFGGEGLIVRKANAAYVSGRNRTILKVKSYQDAEATVVAHIAGKGRNAHRMGALVVELNNGVCFRLGSGFNDAERQNPPAIGNVVTFKYYGTYASGIPKFPSFMRMKKVNDLN